MIETTSPLQRADGAFATVAFIDLAGFTAIADVHGDAAAVETLEIFERMVREALHGYAPPIKWIGDEAMLSFPDPDAAIQALGVLLQSCREEPRLPLTRTAVNHGPVIKRGSDLFGSTVNIAARIAALASAGQMLATRPVAEAARARGIQVRELGDVTIRSVAGTVPLYEIELARATTEEKDSQLERVRDFQARNADDAAAALARLREAATSGENIFAVLMDAARVCSLGQVTEAFFEVGGQYRRNV